MLSVFLLATAHTQRIFERHNAMCMHVANLERNLLKQSLASGTDPKPELVIVNSPQSCKALCFTQFFLALNRVEPLVLLLSIRGVHLCGNTVTNLKVAKGFLLALWRLFWRQWSGPLCLLDCRHLFLKWGLEGCNSPTIRPHWLSAVGNLWGFPVISKKKHLLFFQKRYHHNWKHHNCSLQKHALEL